MVLSKIAGFGTLSSVGIVWTETVHPRKYEEGFIIVIIITDFELRYEKWGIILASCSRDVLTSVHILIPESFCETKNRGRKNTKSNDDLGAKLNTCCIIYLYPRTVSNSKATLHCFQVISVLPKLTFIVLVRKITLKLQQLWNSPESLRIALRTLILEMW